MERDLCVLRAYEHFGLVHPSEVTIQAATWDWVWAQVLAEAHQEGLLMHCLYNGSS